MNASVKDVTSQALTLPRRSRALLADLLLDSLDEGPSADFEREWVELAKKRDVEISEGRVECRSHEEVLARAREAVRCSR